MSDEREQFAADCAEVAAILSYTLPKLPHWRLAWRCSRVRRALWLLVADVERFQIEYIGYPLLGLLRRATEVVRSILHGQGPVAQRRP